MKCNNIEKKKTLGKRKIEIKKIENPSSRQVTFSKRRTGLFHKAAELCTLTDARVGIIVQSLGGNNVFSFGYPNMESVINRYVTGVSTPETCQNSADVLCCKQEYAMVCKKLEAEKKQKQIIDEAKKVGSGEFWWDKEIDTLGLKELEEYLAALDELKKKVMMRADELIPSESSLVPFSDLIIPAVYGDSFSDRVVDQCSNPIYALPYRYELGEGQI